MREASIKVDEDCQGDVRKPKSNFDESKMGPNTLAFSTAGPIAPIGVSPGDPPMMKMGPHLNTTALSRIKDIIRAVALYMRNTSILLHSKPISAVNKTIIADYFFCICIPLTKVLRFFCG